MATLYRFVTNRFSETLPQNHSDMLYDLSTDICLSSPDNDFRYHRVLDGVVTLKIVAYDTNGLIYFDNNPASLPNATANIGGLLVTNANLHVIYPGFFGFRSDALPAYLDIELAVLEPSALAKFRAREEIGPAQATEYLARQIGKTHVFRQRVAIRPAASDPGVRH